MARTLSRRHFLRRAGAPAMLALPMVATAKNRPQRPACTIKTTPRAATCAAAAASFCRPSGIRTA